MRNDKKPMGFRRSRPRRLAFAATALLAGCATAGRDLETVRAFAESSTAGQNTAVLLRIVPPGAAVAAQYGTARLWGIDGGGGGGYPAERSPTRAARDDGWLTHLSVPPGTWFMRLEGAGGMAAAAPADIVFRVPAGPPAVTYIGSFGVTCDGSGGARPCRVEAVPRDESAAAAALVAAEGRGVAPPLTALARPYPPRLADLGLAPPTTPDIRVDTRLWLAAIDWNALATAGPAAAPPAEPRSERDGLEGAEMVSTSGMGGQIGGAIGGGMGAAAGAGGIVALGAMVAVIVVVVPIVLIARAIQQDQRNRRDAEQARLEAERLRRAALAQEQWGPCTAGIAAALAPDTVERHLRTALAPGREAGRRAALPGPWQVTVTRVIFRHCGANPDSHGVEVATRWTATRPGEAEPAFDAALSRGVAGATPDPRLVLPTRPPWELPVASEAACRPLADYCGAGGSVLLLQEVTRGVTEARDAIAGAR